MARIINNTFMGQYGDLVDSIFREWGKEESDQMEIIQEFRDSADPEKPDFRLYVVWEKFRDIPGPIRSKIIIQAYRKVVEQEYIQEGEELDEENWRRHMWHFDVAIGASNAREAGAMRIPGYEEPDPFE